MAGHKEYQHRAVLLYVDHYTKKRIKSVRRVRQMPSTVRFQQTCQMVPAPIWRPQKGDRPKERETVVVLVYLTQCGRTRISKALFPSGG
jgi:hypothetical protein